MPPVFARSVDALAGWRAADKHEPLERDFYRLADVTAPERARVREHLVELAPTPAQESLPCERAGTDAVEDAFELSGAPAHDLFVARHLATDPTESTANRQQES